MIDIHAHILPGLDDGARSLDESLSMIRLSSASGTTDLVATPHANASYPFDPKRVRQSFQALSAQASKYLNLHLGCDFNLNAQNLEDALTNPTIYTINAGPYLMVELPEFLGLSAVREQLRALLHARLRPIITHPERNLQLQSAFDPLKLWVSDGCFVQVTAGSFLGAFGEASRRAVNALMKRNLVHFVASDSHDCMSRTPDLSAAFAHVRDRWGEPRARALFVNHPQAVIHGMSLAPESRAARPSLLSLFRRN